MTVEELAWQTSNTICICLCYLPTTRQTNKISKACSWKQIRHYVRMMWAKRTTSLWGFQSHSTACNAVQYTQVSWRSLQFHVTGSSLQKSVITILNNTNYSVTLHKPKVYQSLH